MRQRSASVIVVGAGIFGVTAALSLRRRGHIVKLLDPGPLPHPLAASTDISKAIRFDYGADVDYMAWMERALDGWRRWNRDLAAPDAPPLFHEDGVMYLSRAPLAPGGFEHDSFHLMRARGHAPQPLDRATIAARFPAWNSDLFAHGYYNPEGGYAESGRVVDALLRRAAAEGVTLHDGPQGHVVRLTQHGARITGVELADGSGHSADAVVVTVGSWTRFLLPDLSPALRSVGMPVFHLRPADPSLFVAARFPTFGADIAQTGYYGFPLHREGVVKIARHSVGRPLHPESPARQVTPAETADLRDFLRTAFPALADAPIVATRVCLYCDTADEHLWIAPHASHPGLVVATGDSGHGFKFAPVLGDFIADATAAALESQSPSETTSDPLIARLHHKFRHRPESITARGEEAARHHGTSAT